MNLSLKKIQDLPLEMDDLRITRIGKTIKYIIAEYNLAILKETPLNSAHEGWALLQQEMDELWNEVKKGESERSKDVMLKEAAQIGALAMRFIVDQNLGDKCRREL